MKKFVLILLLPISFYVFAQEKTSIESSDDEYKKRVLENVEIDVLTSYYYQDGNNAAVTGGIGTEELTDFATNINISIPLNDDDILVIDGTISAYTSASSSNLNPFSTSSASGTGDDDDDDDKNEGNNGTGENTGSPWVSASGASRQDTWTSYNLGYSHSSDSRNEIYSANISYSTEFDYNSFGFGGGFSKLFNQKNTEIGVGFNLYFDKWRPFYPTEIKTYSLTNGDLDADFFKGVDILDENGTPINKNGNNIWKPTKDVLIENESRNTIAFMLNFSQILSKNLQISLFSDITIQTGWLANPLQRVYFSDIDNFYIGNANSINKYTDSSNRDVFQLADDIERLPNSRLKIPIGLRLHYYINEFLITKVYYRNYFDDWGLQSNTINIELPIKLGGNLTIYPNYRFYNQSAVKYFAPYEKNKSTDSFYTSDYDLSELSASQYGLGIKYTDILTKIHVDKVGLKTISFNYNYYDRTTGLKSHIFALGAKIIIN